MNDLQMALIAKHLKTRWMGRDIELLETVDSTQNKARALAALGRPDGTLVLAENQSAGRGQQERRWESPSGGLWASLILKPKFPANEFARFGLVSSLAIANSIEELLNVSCAVKWPNDVWLTELRETPSQKKVCGILLESEIPAGTPTEIPAGTPAEKNNLLILGIGINVHNSIPENLRNNAISLDAVAAKKVDRSQLCAHILNRLENYFELFEESGFAPFYDEYSKKCLWKGETVLLQEGTQLRQGRFKEITPNGAIVLEERNGNANPFVAGEISLRKN